MDAIEKLIALEHIRQLKARYFRYVDTKDWAGLAEVFASDARFDRTTGRSVYNPWTGLWDPPLTATPHLIEGRAAIVTMIRGVVEDLATIHHGHMPEIIVQDAQHATGLWAMSDELRDQQGHLILLGRGHYHEAYRVEDGQWRIAYCKLTRLHVERHDPAKQGS